MLGFIMCVCCVQRIRRKRNLYRKMYKMMSRKRADRASEKPRV